MEGFSANHTIGDMHPAVLYAGDIYVRAVNSCWEMGAWVLRSEDVLGAKLKWLG